jgi:hypothetical protein
MTTINTDDLTPRQINMLVAAAEGWVPPEPAMKMHWAKAPRGAAIAIPGAVVQPASEPPDYCSDWRLVGPIIERDKISVRWDDETLYGKPQNRWLAEAEGLGYAVEGTGAATAAMRAHVHRRYGDTITITDKPWLLEAAES